MTFKKFKKIWDDEILPNKPDYIRRGQSLMNHLATVWLEEYNRITSVHFYDRTDIDCFYNDALIPNTLEHLEKVWEAPLSLYDVTDAVVPTGIKFNIGNETVLAFEENGDVYVKGELVTNNKVVVNAAYEFFTADKYREIEFPNQIKE